VASYAWGWAPRLVVAAEHRRTTQEGQGRTMLEAPQPLTRDWHAGGPYPVLGTSQTTSMDGHRVYCVGSITAGPEKRKDYYLA
jgi:hypothetical protein